MLAIVVNTAVDELDGSIVDGDVSLRDALAAAAVGEPIIFNDALNGATINLTLGELVIDRSLTIDTPGLPLGVTIDASGNDLTPTVNNGDGSRVFRITDGTAADLTVELRGLTITGGDITGSGGGIQNFERLTLANTKVQANSARGGQGSGGGVWSQNATNLTIRDSTLTGNAASLAGGGLWARVAGGDTLSLLTSTISGNTAGTAGGGVYAYTSDAGLTSIQDSTASGNTAGGDGGGMYLRTTPGGGSKVIQNTISGNSARWRGGGMFVMSVGVTTEVRFNTITANTADSDANNPVIETGGGIYAGGTGTLKLEQTIVAANIDTGNHAPDLKVASGTLQTSYNLIGTNGGSGLAPAPIATPDANGNIVGAGVAVISPGLEPLSNNGGLTPTHALSPMSAAVNRGNPVVPSGTPTYDQRGNPFGRLLAGPGTFRLDIGAFELPSATIDTLVVSSLADEDDGNTTAGHLSIREIFRIAHEYPTPSTILFDPALSGGTINLTRGPLTFTRMLTVDASALADGITLDAGGLSRVFQVNTIGGATLRGLTISRATEAVRVFQGPLEVDDCLFEANGLAIATASFAAVRNSTIRGGGGGVEATAHSGVLVEDSFIVNNTGVGIFSSQANTTVRRSTISGNKGAGISVSSRLVIEQSTISGNMSDGVRLDSAFYDATISNSTMANNTGAGIQANHAGGLTITNCTVSNNGNRGVASTYQFAVPPITRHSTIVDNTGGRGAGVWSQHRSAFIFNSIISGNTDTTGYEHDVMAHDANLYYSLVGRRNPSNPYGPPINKGGSIIGTNASPVDPLLGPFGGQRRPNADADAAARQPRHQFRRPDVDPQHWHDAVIRPARRGLWPHRCWAY